jgi:hypothetical protein
LEFKVDDPQLMRVMRHGAFLTSSNSRLH